jgi:hypothetical protein
LYFWNKFIIYIIIIIHGCVLELFHSKN